MRRTPRTLVAIAVTIVIVAAACSVSQQHGYVQSADGSLSFRHPPEWENVDLVPVTAEWIAGIDASSEPNRGNVTALVLKAPFVLAEVYPLEGSARDSISLQSLRELALNNGVDPTADDDPTLRLLFHNTIVDENGFEGHHMRFEVDVDGGTAIEEQLAVFDVERRRVHRVRVACSIDCFEANDNDIDDLFDSIRLRP